MFERPKTPPPKYDQSFETSAHRILQCDFKTAEDMARREIQMLDAAAVPVLLKAVDWMFGEASKILQERRERRKAEQLHDPTDNKSETLQPSSSSSITIQAKEVALHSPIEDTIWKNSEAHVRHLLSLLEIYVKNYHLAREQYAKWGTLAPPIIIHTLSEAEDKIVEVTRDLQAVLSVIYGKKVANPELELA